MIELAAGWLSSNVLFVITWCWLHSRKDRSTQSIFRLHSDSAYQPQ